MKLRVHTCPLRTLPADHFAAQVPVSPFVPGSGITSLGVPCDFPGSSAQSSSVWASARDRCVAALRSLDDLPDLQLQFVLLRACLIAAG